MEKVEQAVTQTERIAGCCGLTKRTRVGNFKVLRKNNIRSTLVDTGSHPRVQQTTKFPEQFSDSAYVTCIVILPLHDTGSHLRAWTPTRKTKHLLRVYMCIYASEGTCARCGSTQIN